MDKPANHFELQADYKPAGDQPQAIESLVEGLESGLSHQTLLGVTGSGKSIGYDDPLYVVEQRGHERIPQLVKAGPFIDSLMVGQGTGFGQAAARPSAMPAPSEATGRLPTIHRGARPVNIRWPPFCVIARRRQCSGCARAAAAKSR
jgi:hypothetical protein